MTLEEYMRAEGLTDNEVAARVQRDRSRVYRWRKQISRPDFDALIEIEKMSKGRVTAADFAKDAR